MSFAASAYGRKNSEDAPESVVGEQQLAWVVAVGEPAGAQGADDVEDANGGKEGRARDLREAVVVGRRR